MAEDSPMIEVSIPSLEREVDESGKLRKVNCCRLKKYLDMCGTVRFKTYFKAFSYVFQQLVMHILLDI